MKRNAHVAPAVMALALGMAVAAPSLRALDKPTYPPAHKAPVVDDYHGTKVPDPYRWLEDADAPETVAWVEAENALTRSLVERPVREAIRKRLTELYDYPRVSVPKRRGTRYFYSRNTGLQNQGVLYVREGLAGHERVLLDPNALSADGTVALTATSPTADGALLGYALSRSGSDRQEIFVKDVATGKDLPDKIRWAKFTSLSWTPDKRAFYYTRFPEPGTVPAGDENYFARVYLHRLGEPQAQDDLVFETPKEKEVIAQAEITRDGRFVVIVAFRGASDKSEVYVLDRTRPGSAPALLAFSKGFRSSYIYVEEVDGRLFFQTDDKAPLGRVIAVDAGKGGTEPVAVLPEGSDKLDFVAIVNRRLVTARLKDASHRVHTYSLAGSDEKEVELKTLGSVTSVTGEPDHEELFLGFTSYIRPMTSYRYDFKSGRLEEFEKVPSRFDSAAFEVGQAWYPSKDGTKISMFLVHKKGLAKDGQRPTLLYGYGGFNVSETPAFSPARVSWLERGGVLALANLRGGGEYGEAWHEAGMLERKQNVFDDFVGAAEWLIANGYTRREKLAIQGGSNGGLLVGAVMVQRPELFGAVVCQVPVADMLRYHRFTVGRFWIPEYGSADDPAQFPFLFRYSPYHNVKDGTAYPATLVTTADTDDRVAPGMAKKFAARLQEATRGSAPILIRVETKAGHGAGKPVTKQIDEQADVYAFLLWQLGEI